MKSVNISGLKNNPSEALRHARKELVLVMNRNKPDALMIGLEKIKTLDLPGVRIALATALFRDGDLSLARAARVADMPLDAFISHLSRLGISVIDQTQEEVEQDMETLDQWLES